MSPRMLTVRKWDCVIDGRPTHVVDWSIDQEWVDVSTLSNREPDPRWAFTDENGHFHAYDGDGKTPTLRRVAEEHWCSDCEEHETTYTDRCVLCGEDVTPAMVDRGPVSKMIPGRRTATMTVRYRDMGEALPYHSAVSVHLTRRDDDHAWQEYFGVMHVAGGVFGPEGATQTLTGELHQRLGK